MKSHCRRLYLLLFLVAVNGAWAGDALPIESVGNNVYSVTVKAHTKFTRDTQKLKDEAMEIATQFCTKDGKQLKVVSIKEEKNQFLVGPFAQTTLTFKALVPDDLELAQATPTATQVRPPVPASPATEQLYADILRLNELRKQGLLTDAEFETEKKKVLERSK